MSGSITMHIQLFGALRAAAPNAQLVLEVPHGSNASAIKAAISDKLTALNGKPITLVNDSVLADDHSILGADFVAHHDLKLALLPPVCGG